MPPHREAGLITIIDPGSDKPLDEIMMVQCVHCGGQFPEPRFGSSEADKTSRIGRGFCMKCNGYICGAGCQKCVPVEQLLENIEHGRDLEFRPVTVGWSPLLERSG